MYDMGKWCQENPDAERDHLILGLHSAVAELLGHVTVAELEEVISFAVEEALNDCVMAQ